jgi:UDP-N-acetylglucosamine/UDP-N-acetylgalactosamine diphosphorylase
MEQKSNEKALRTALISHNQEHLLDFFDQLDQNAKNSLIDQINALDLEEIGVWVQNIVKNPAPPEIPATFGPAPAYTATASGPQQQQKYQQATELGEDLLRSGKVAAFVVAGGQGTRLGFDGPKGDFPISPVKNKTLFRIFAETIVAVENKYSTNCPWYIMTSPLNHNQTIEIFEKNQYYGLDRKKVSIFPQATLPNFSPDGRILLADKATIASSPDGHGGSLKALYKSGAVEDMKKRGVKHISYFQVDNPLINIFDPLFIGLHALEKAQMSSKALPKTDPMEKVGNFCLADGKVTVIEYSDLPDELAEKQNPDGSLVFQLGSIAIHIIDVDFVEKLNEKGFSLPIHRALKKVPSINENAELIEPVEPNGIKLETFVFDALPLAQKSIILQTIRKQEFAPVKDDKGADSPETTRKMMIERAADWLESAGVTVPKKSDGSVDCIIEIAPSFAVAKEDVKQKLDRIPKINPGDEIYLD